MLRLSVRVSTERAPKLPDIGYQIDGGLGHAVGVYNTAIQVQCVLLRRCGARWDEMCEERSRAFCATANARALEGG